MKIKIEAIKENPVSLLRRMGYIFQRKEGEEMSFVRPLAQSGYPRFHMYVKVDAVDLIISIHLDQKKNTYGENTRHHGEYEESPVLEEEVRRIKLIAS